MIQKTPCRCATNVLTTIHICVEISVHHASISTFSHSYRLVNIFRRLCQASSSIQCNLFWFPILCNFWFSEILPLVEFTPEEEILDQEVERLLLAPPKSNMESIDPFVDTMINEDVSDILPLTLDRDALRALEPTTILIAKWPPPLKVRYYRNLMPEWQISMCPECLQVSSVAINNLWKSFYQFGVLFLNRVRSILIPLGISLGRLWATGFTKGSLSILSRQFWYSIELKLKTIDCDFEMKRRNISRWKTESVQTKVYKNLLYFSIAKWRFFWDRVVYFEKIKIKWMKKNRKTAFTWLRGDFIICYSSFAFVESLRHGERLSRWNSCDVAVCIQSATSKNKVPE